MNLQVPPSTRGSWVLISTVLSRVTLLIFLGCSAFFLTYLFGKLRGGGGGTFIPTKDCQYEGEHPNLSHFPPKSYKQAEPNNIYKRHPQATNHEQQKRKSNEAAGSLSGILEVLPLSSFLAGADGSVVADIIGCDP